MFSTIAFVVLTIFYGIQLWLTWIRSGEQILAPTPSGKEKETTLRLALKCFDGGYQNTIWTFLILAIFLPIVLASISDVAPLLDIKQHDATKVDRNTVQLPRLPKVLYFLYVSGVCVIITLEFSYIQNLRRLAPEWIPFLIVAVVLDLTTLLVFILGVKHPHTWALEYPSPWTQWGMLLTTIAAVMSSAFILILSRVASALNSGQIDIPEAVEEEPVED